MMKYFKNPKNKKTIVVIAVITLLLLLILTLKGCSSVGYDANSNSQTLNIFDLTKDENASLGEFETHENNAEKLNTLVDENMLNISMNSNPTVINRVANLLITNAKSNAHPQVIEIYTKDNMRVYRSGAIAVGNKLENGTLDVNLSQGEHECIAYFNAIDENSGELVGKVGVNIVLTVQ